MDQEFKVVTSAWLEVDITSSISSFPSHKRFSKDLTIGDLKGKLELIAGTSSSATLEVYDKDNKTVCLLDDVNRLLGSYPIDDGMRIHAVDKVHKVGEFEDVSKVEKFEISEDEYAKKTDSVRAFKQKMKLGRFQDQDPEEQNRIKEENKKKEEEEKQLVENMCISNRCEVRAVKQPVKRGVVMYIGTTDFQPGCWIGVKYDEPMGKNDGSVQGKRYFECPPKYGGFVKPTQVTVGDYPELGLDEDLDEM